MHPLDMLTGAEIERAVAIARADGRLPDDALFAHIVLHEPDKALSPMGQRLDSIEQPLPDALSVVSQRSHVEGLRLI